MFFVLFWFLGCFLSLSFLPYYPSPPLPPDLWANKRYNTDTNRRGPTSAKVQKLFSLPPLTDKTAAGSQEAALKVELSAQDHSLACKCLYLLVCARACVLTQTHTPPQCFYYSLEVFLTLWAGNETLDLQSAAAVCSRGRHILREHVFHIKSHWESQVHWLPGRQASRLSGCVGGERRGSVCAEGNEENSKKEKKDEKKGRALRCLLRRHRPLARRGTRGHIPQVGAADWTHSSMGVESLAGRNFSPSRCFIEERIKICLHLTCTDFYRSWRLSVSQKFPDVASKKTLSLIRTKSFIILSLLPQS